MASSLFIVAAQHKSSPSRHHPHSHSHSKFSRTSDWPTTRKWRLRRNVTTTKPALPHAGTHFLFAGGFSRLETLLRFRLLPAEGDL